MLDERFILHRYKSTSHAGVAAAIALGAWFLYEFHVEDVIRWDLLSILGIMALVKIGCMIWYRARD